MIVTLPGSSGVTIPDEFTEASVGSELGQAVVSVTSTVVASASVAVATSDFGPSRARTNDAVLGVIFNAVIGLAGPLGRAINEAGGDRGVLADAYRGLGIAWRWRGDLDKAMRRCAAGSRLARRHPKRSR